MVVSTPRVFPVALALVLIGGCAASSPASAPSSSPAGEKAEPVKQGSSSGGSETAEPTKTSAVLPDFTLETTEGERFRLSDHVGSKVIVMSFWATWCNPCMAELPHLDEIYQDEKENGLLIVAVAMDEPGTVAEVAPTAARLGLTMPVVLDTDQRAVRLYNRSRDAPRTVVINRKGEVVRSSAGYNPGDEEKLRAEVRVLLTQ